MEIETIVHRLTVDIHVLNKWFTNNGLVLNEDKCQFLIAESSRAVRDETSIISFCNKTITELQKGKVLGITLDKYVTMAGHIQKMCKQASNKLQAQFTDIIFDEVFCYITI